MPFQFHGRAQDAAENILQLFQTGDVPTALAPVFIRRKDGVPCRAWSWNNQLLTALAGHDDARGYRQWQEVGRHVCKGERGFPILVPCHAKRTVRDDDTGEERTVPVLVGFRSCVVFGYGQTDGEPLPDRVESDRFVEALPLVDVARSWSLSVGTYNGRSGGALGKYRGGHSIALGVENLATWAHELCHAADDRLGNLNERGQHWRSETVAELGGAILLSCVGLDKEADPGGCWEYVRAYASAAKIEPVTACQRVLKRTCDAVALILSEYDRIQAERTAAATVESEVAA